MTSDPIEAMTESAKALQEVAKTGAKAVDASRSVGGWLDRIFGQGIEDTVALHWSDRIRARRIERAIYDWGKLTELMSKVESRLKAKGITRLRLVPPKIALGIIEKATIEDEDELHSLWGNLLVSGLDADFNQIQMNYISVLTDLTCNDAIVLKDICNQWLDPLNTPKSDRYGSLTYGPSVDGTATHDATSVVTLNRLGLISPGYIDVTNYRPSDDISYKNPEPFNVDDVRVYGDLGVVQVTEFGIAFFKAVIAD